MIRLGRGSGVCDPELLGEGEGGKGKAEQLPVGVRCTRGLRGPLFPKCHLLYRIDNLYYKISEIYGHPRNNSAPSLTMIHAGSTLGTARG